MERAFVIGDIHGSIDKLENLFNKIPVDWTKDLFIFLGDYIDRGPDPKAVVQFLIELRLRHPENFIFLKGNHEVMFMDFLQGKDISPAFLQFGGKNTLKSYGLDSSDFGKGTDLISPSHLEFLLNLRISHQFGPFFMVHAGVRPKVPLALQREEDMLWIRDEFIRSNFEWGKRIIFGHTVFEVPLIQKNKIGIDTGAVYGGRLTCLILPVVDFIFS